MQVEKNTTILISGSDKCVIGDLCATIRRQRPPEPYKGKGIRYQGEVIKLKDGKVRGELWLGDIVFSDILYEMYAPNYSLSVLIAGWRQEEVIKLLFKLTRTLVRHG